MLVAIAACRAGIDAGPDDLYPDADGPLLQAALDRAGVDSVLVAWDDPRQDWSSFDRVVVRSTWDSVDRPQEFLAWARLAAEATALLNPLAAIETTLDKSYLQGLADRGVALPHTQFVSPGATWTPPDGDFVVKPSISGGGRETALYKGDEAVTAGEHVLRLNERGSTAIVQEHIAEVGHRGEVKLVFVAGRFTHAIRTDPLLRHGTGVLERPWEVPTNPVVVDPTQEEIRFAVETLSKIEELSAARTAYARVDVVSRSSDDVVLMEVELIDPSLSLWANPDAAGELAAAIERWPR
jgi:glutathione synthase/RimK-type ligase-like ATP-grasp enzyme